MKTLKEQNFEKELPSGYRQALYINAKNAKFGIIFNLIAVVVLIIVMAIAILSLHVGGKLSSDILKMEYTQLTFTYLIFFALMIGYIILHELVHGIAYKTLTGEKLTFGISWSCAFCGVPHIFTYRRTAIISVISPFAVFTVLFVPILVLLYCFSPLYYLLTAFLFGLHLGGCSGDLYVLYLLTARFKGQKTLMRDTGPEQFFYVSDEEMFKKAKWIYASCEADADQYTEYVDVVPKAYGNATMFISCDSDYTLFVNGRYVASNQYGDFEHYKIYDTLDLTTYLTESENRIKIILYHCGVDTQRYRKAEAGLIYEITSDDKLLASSSEKTLSRLSPTYVSGAKRYVSRQLGFTFTYDATKESEDGYCPSVTVDKNVTFFPRPIKKQTLLKPRESKKVTKLDKETYLVDLGEEVVGLATLDIISSEEQTVRVAWGESLTDGRVRRKIGSRHFYFDYTARKGRNTFTDYMLRLGCRYLEITANSPIEILCAGILPQVYEVERSSCQIDSPLDRQIYDICVNTLELCMMEHYVDTPWREQCLYAFDSRNQMLCGYFAFEGGNRDYVRANLKLMGEDRRADGLLSICYPCGTELAIPSFSLYYVIAMREYMNYTGDTSLAAEYSLKIEGILDEFLKNSKDGLINTFAGEQMWNFYDWSRYLEGSIHKNEGVRPDLVINCLFVLALDAYESMCEATGIGFKYGGKADELRRLIATEFKRENGLLSLRKEGDEYTALGNSLAILCGAVSGEDARNVCDKIVSGEATPSSLSMNVWKYDALILTDAERYNEYILREIRETYKKMLDAGSTTVWETAEGAPAFSGAGSLCHGWSAVPIYVFHKLRIAK